MARDRGGQCKQCRREGIKLYLKGERCLTDKCGVERRAYPPGDHGRGRQKQSEYRLQLREKQKARRPNDVLAYKAGSSAAQVIRDATELISVVPAWLQADHDGLTAKILRHPERSEIDTPVQEQLIVELYSK